MIDAIIKSGLRKLWTKDQLGKMFVFLLLLFLS